MSLLYPFHIPTNRQNLFWLMEDWLYIQRVLFYAYSYCGSTVAFPKFLFIHFLILCCLLVGPCLKHHCILQCMSAGRTQGKVPNSVTEMFSWQEQKCLFLELDTLLYRRWFEMMHCQNAIVFNNRGRSTTKRIQIRKWNKSLMCLVSSTLSLW